MLQDKWPFRLLHPGGGGDVGGGGWQWFSKNSVVFQNSKTEPLKIFSYENKILFHNFYF